MSARSIWNGALSFGLVTVPVKAYKATDDKNAETAMHEFHSCGADEQGNPKYSPAKRKQECEACAKQIEADSIVKGVVRDSKVIVLSKEDLATIKPPSSETIVVESFVKTDTIEVIYIRDTYYITPSAPAGIQPYALLLAAMTTEGMSAQGQWTVYGRTNNVIVEPFGAILAVHLMRTKTEVRALDTMPGYIAPGSVTLKPVELKMARQIVTTNVTEFDGTEYEDEYIAGFRELVAAKEAGTAVAGVVTTPAKPVADLMAALQASMTLAKKPKVAKAVQTASGPKSTKGVKKAPKGAPKGKSGPSEATV